MFTVYEALKPMTLLFLLFWCLDCECLWMILQVVLTPAVDLETTGSCFAHSVSLLHPCLFSKPVILVSDSIVPDSDSEEQRNPKPFWIVLSQLYIFVNSSWNVVVSLSFFFVLFEKLRSSANRIHDIPTTLSSTVGQALMVDSLQPRVK